MLRPGDARRHLKDIDLMGRLAHGEQCEGESSSGAASPRGIMSFPSVWPHLWWAGRSPSASAAGSSALQPIASRARMIYECCRISFGALLSFVVVSWLVLAQCPAWVFTAFLVHGHLPTQAACLQMPAFVFWKYRWNEQLHQAELCVGGQAASHHRHRLFPVAGLLRITPHFPLVSGTLQPRNGPVDCWRAVMLEDKTLSGSFCYA